MNDELRDATLVFCEKQLTGAIEDAEVSVRAATQDFFSVRRLSQGLAADTAGAGATELLAVVDRVIVALQFFDEHAQRVRHVVQVLNLLIEENTRRQHAAVGDELRPLMDKLRTLLSTESEWRIFAEMFPGEDAGHHPGDEVELF